MNVFQMIWCDRKIVLHPDVFGNLFHGDNSLLTLSYAVCRMIWYSPVMTLAALALTSLLFVRSLPTYHQMVTELAPNDWPYKGR